MRSKSKNQVQPLLPGERYQDGFNFSKQLKHIKTFFLNVPSAVFDGLKLQDRVEHPLQAIGGNLRESRTLPLFGAPCGYSRNLRRTEDRVKRRAQFVTDHG